MGGTGLRERLHWAEAIRQTLREGDEQLRESTWARWLEQYWKRRNEAIPVPLDPKEVGAMVSWALALSAHFSEAVTLLGQGPAPQANGSMVYFELDQMNAASKYPVPTAHLLAMLLSEEKGDQFWEIDQVHTMVAHLIEVIPNEPSLINICEELARIGSPRALELRQRLQEKRGEDPPDRT